MKLNLKRPFLIKSLILFIGIIVIIFLLNNLIMPWYVSSPEHVVPELIGKQLPVAEKLLADNDLQLVISDTTYDEKYPKGSVLFQKPDGGEVVKSGRRVYLFISGGEPIIPVPNLKGKSLRDAKFSLERLGLVLGQVEDVSSNNPKDMIFDQQYAEGTPLRKGESVSVTMSIGNTEGLMVVPDLSMKSLAEATAILADSLLSVGKISYQSSYSFLPNTVVDQYPSKGSKVNIGSKIDLFVTKNSDQ